MKQALADREDRPEELVSSGYHADMIFRAGQRALSLRAGKLWHILVKLVGADLSDERMHTVSLAELSDTGLGHMTRSERIEALRELQTTLIELKKPSIKVKGLRYVSGPLLAHVERDEDDAGNLVFEFSRTAREIFANSEHWAILSKRAVLSFESRYSLRLYEMIAARVNLNYVTSETYSIEDLRSRLGVEIDKMTRWADFRRFVLEAAIAEVNQLSGFRIRYEAIKRSRAVASVKLYWAKKPDEELKDTKRELDGSRIGRKARRDGTAEKISTPDAIPHVIEFPSTSIRHTPFEHIAKSNLPLPMRDIDQVANVFREAARRDGKPLRGNSVTEMFAAFCRAQKPAN